jgi:uncharacterized protein YqfB (UPF0267 family)
MKQYIGISRDHSRSMLHITKDAMKDYNSNISVIKAQASKHSVDTIVSVVKCGDGYNGVTRDISNSSVQTLRPLKEYIANGNNTPLWDSVGDLIEQFEGVPDANDPMVSFMVMVITDGQENGSRKWSISRLATKMKNLQATDRWTFIFRVPKGDKTALTRHGVPEGNILEWEQNTKGVEVATQATEQAFRSFYTGRTQGVTSTQRFYADLSDVSLKDVKAVLVDISPEVTIFKVKPDEDGKQIRDFISQRTKKVFVKGTAFYQLTKTETLQDYKQIAVRDKLKGSVYSGVAARDMLNLPDSGEVKLSPGAHGQFDIFVQSTSVNRKLVENTNVLYWPGAN